MSAAREGDGARLLELVEAAERGQEPVLGAGEGGRAEEPYPDAIRLLDAPAPEPVRWAVDQIALHDITLFAGEPGSWKSSVLVALLGAWAGGYEAFGRFATDGPVVVLLVSEEDPREVIQNRVEALIAGHGWDRERVLGHFYVHALDGLRLDDPTTQACLLAEARALGARVIGLDPLADVMDGSTEKNDDAKVMVRFWRRLVAEGMDVVVAHHLNKPPGDGTARDKIHRVRGATSWVAAARMVWWVEPLEVGVQLECLKAARSRKPEPFLLTRTIQTDPACETTWLKATMTAKAETAAAGVLNDRDLAVLGIVVKAVNAPNSTDLRRLVRKAGSKANNEQIDDCRAGLLAAGLIRWEKDGREKRWHPTDEGRAAYARAREGATTP